MKHLSYEESLRELGLFSLEEKALWRHSSISIPKGGFRGMMGTDSLVGSEATEQEVMVLKYKRVDSN